MKKTVAIFFAIVLLFNSTGLMFFYLLKMQECKTEADRYSNADYDFSKSLIVSFVKGDGNFQLLNEKELSSDGMLFDIVKTENHNGKIVYQAVRDDKEEGYLLSVLQLSKSNSDANSPPMKNATPDALKYISNHTIFDASITSAQPDFLRMISLDQLFYNSPFQNIFSPPPEVFVS